MYITNLGLFFLCYNNVRGDLVKKYLNDNKFGVISVGLVVLSVILTFLWLATISGIPFVLGIV